MHRGEQVNNEGQDVSRENESDNYSHRQQLNEQNIKKEKTNGKENTDPTQESPPDSF